MDRPGPPIQDSAAAFVTAAQGRATYPVALRDPTGAEQTVLCHTAPRVGETVRLPGGRELRVAGVIHSFGQPHPGVPTPVPGGHRGPGGGPGSRGRLTGRRIRGSPP